jgi:hypothetical protein
MEAQPENRITSVADLLEKVANFKVLDEHHRHLRIWYRGQGNAEWKLRPGVHRDGFADDEVEGLKKEAHLIKDFRALGAGILTGRESNEELYFIQQHYGMPTRLLDWSTSPLTALWFAVSSSQKDKDGQIAIMDANQLLTNQGVIYNDKEFIGIASSRNPAFMSAIRPMFEWGKLDSIPTYIIPVRPDYNSERLGHQSSCFTFHGRRSSELTESENVTLCKYIVPKDIKAAIRKELATLGVNSFSIYGDLDSLSKKMKYSYKIEDLA